MTLDVAYMICTTPRTGATALLETLRGSGVAGEPWEHPDSKPVGGVFGTMVQWAQMNMAPIPVLPPANRYVYFQLWRRDTLAQAVSWVIARQTGRWRSSSPTVNCRLTYKPDVIARTMDRIRADNAAWQRWLAERSPVAFTYEEMAGDYPAMVRHLLEVLGIEPPKTITGPSLTRMADARNEEWIRRMRED